MDDRGRGFARGHSAAEFATRWPPRSARSGTEAYGKVAPRDERVRVLGAEHPFPVEQHLTEDLERLVHLIVPAQAGTKVVAGDQSAGMIRTLDALLIAEQLRQDIKRLVKLAGLGSPRRQIVAAVERGLMVSTQGPLPSSSSATIARLPRTQCRALMLDFPKPAK
jgi:hypothetical protein